MQIRPFQLERYFARYEFSVKYLLSASDCESLTLRELLELGDARSLALWEDLRLGYTESQGHPDLRAEIAGLYARVAPEQVLVAAPEEAIFIAMHSLLQPGDRVVVTLPAYQSLYEVARSIGCRVEGWRLEADDRGRWHLDFDRLEALLAPPTRLLVVNFPHNPTGFLPTANQQAQMVAAARRFGVPIFSDEMYRGLEYHAGQQLPAMCDLYEQGVTLSGMSKAYGLPGLRIGWLAAPTEQAAAGEAPVRDQAAGGPPLREAMERWMAIKDYTTICNSAPSEVLAILALRAREVILTRNRAILADNLAAARDFFSAHPGHFAWMEPEAGAVAFPRWTGGGAVEAFCQAIVEQQGVMVVPGSLFEHPGEHFRIGLGRRNLPAALERVADFLSKI